VKRREQYLIQQDTHAHPLVLVSVAAPEDTTLLTQWETHLQPLRQEGGISVWSELHLTAGADRVQEFQRQIDDADLVVLLLSADFFISLECLAMRDRALERARDSTTRVIALPLRPVDWQVPPLGHLTPWPPNRKPIMLWNNQDEGWHACIQELRRLLGRRVLEELPLHPPKHPDPDWDHMLRRLRESYKELRDQSLHGTPWMELGLTRRPDMVSNQTNLLYRFPDGGEQLLAPGTPIVDAYDKAVGELLILGAPGAGKSTLLLDLARQLVGRAFADPLYPLPVILRLSSWARQRPALKTWMIDVSYVCQVGRTAA
jgi:TIR domain